MMLRALTRILDELEWILSISSILNMLVALVSTGEAHIKYAAYGLLLYMMAAAVNIINFSIIEPSAAFCSKKNKL